MQFSYPARQQGKSLVRESYYKYAIDSGRRMVIGTADPDKIFNELKSKYPNARLKKIDHGVVINDS